MSEERIVTRSAARLARAIASGDLDAPSVWEAFHARVRAREPDVQALVDRRFERAPPGLRARSPLGGVPFGVKDIIDTADLPTQYGSPIYRHHQPLADADVVALLREAGGAVAAKTVSTEFGIRTARETRNPFDLRRTPGGSSSGSAAAVADGMLPFALGTQTTASIVRPAGFCGVFGFKPTLGLVPRTGLMLHSPSMDTIGFVARHAEDLTLLLDVATTPDARQALDVRDAAHHTREADRPRLGFLRSAQWDLAAATTRQILEAAAAAVDGGAFDVVEVTAPPEMEAAWEAQRILHVWETTTCLAGDYERARELFSPPLQDLMEEGRKLPPSDYLRAREAVLTAQGAARGLFADGLDAVITPSVEGEAPVGLENTGNVAFCRIWSALGLPSISVPGLKGPAGLPLGVQLVSPWHLDRHLVRRAALLAEAFGYDPGRLPDDALQA